MNPTKIAYEQRYSDDSGVEYGVRFDANRITREIEIESIDTVEFPADQIDWLIDSLCSIRTIIRGTP
jgi:hypothetical protein